MAKLVQFSTAETLIKNATLETNPDADLREGSSHYETFVRPVSTIIQTLNDELTDIKNTNNIYNLKQSANIGDNIEDDLDKKAEDYFITRRQGGKASGYVRLYFSSPADKVVTTNTEFYTLSGLTYSTTSETSISKAQMGNNYDVTEDAYFMEILIEAENTGEEYVVDAGEIVSTNDESLDTVKIRNMNDFSSIGVATKESDTEFLTRIENIIGVRNLLEPLSAKNLILEEFDYIAACQVLKGYSDFSLRSRMMVLNPDFIENPTNYMAGAATIAPADFATAITAGSEIIKTPNKIDYYLKNNFLGNSSINVDLIKEEAKGNLQLVIDGLITDSADGNVRVKFIYSADVGGGTPSWAYTNLQYGSSHTLTFGVGQIFEDSNTTPLQYRGPTDDNGSSYGALVFTNVGASASFTSTTLGGLANTNYNGGYDFVEGTLWFDVPVVAWSGAAVIESNLYNKAANMVLYHNAGAIAVSAPVPPSPNPTMTDYTQCVDEIVTALSTDGITGGEDGARYFLNLNQHRYLNNDEPVDNVAVAGEDTITMGASSTNYRYIASMFSTTDALLLRQIDIYLDAYIGEDVRYWICESVENDDGYEVPKFSAKNYLAKGNLLTPRENSWINLMFNDVELEENTNYFLVLKTGSARCDVGVASDVSPNVEVETVIGSDVCDITGNNKSHIMTSSTEVYPLDSEWTVWNVEDGAGTPVTTRHCSFKMDIFNTIIESPMIGLKKVSELPPGTAETDTSTETIKDFTIVQDSDTNAGECDYLPVDYDWSSSPQKFRLVADIYHSSASAFTFSTRENMKLKMPQYDESDATPSAFNLKTLKIEYYYGDNFITVQDYLESDEHSSSANDPLIFHYWPVFIDGTIYYSGTATTDSVVAYVKDKINKNLISDIGNLIKSIQTDLDVTYIDLPLTLTAEAHFPNGWKEKTTITNKLPCLYLVQAFMARDIKGEII